MHGYFGDVVTAMITPFDTDGSLNVTEAQNLAKHLTENGSEGLVLSGTTGESPTLNKDEKIALFKEVKDAVGPNVKVLAGTGSYDTAESIELTRAAEKVGVDGIMLVTPYYNRPPQAGLIKHFRAIAGAVTLPVMLYNIPIRTAVNVEPASIIELSKTENIVAVKEASGNFGAVSDIDRETDEDFQIYSGQDEWTLAMMALGATGVVSVTSHVVGKEIKSMIAKMKAGAAEEAKAIHNRLMPIFKALFITTNPIMVKAAVRELGFEPGPVRLPLIEATSDQINELKKVLELYR